MLGLVQCRSTLPLPELRTAVLPAGPSPPVQKNSKLSSIVFSSVTSILPPILLLTPSNSFHLLKHPQFSLQTPFKMSAPALKYKVADIVSP